jgi:uncharacterized protein (DUF58 family)
MLMSVFSLVKRNRATAPAAEEEGESAGRNVRARGLKLSQVSQAWMYGAGAMIVLGAVLGSQPLFGLGLLLVAAIGVAWLWTHFCLRNLTIERRFSQTRAFYGEELDMAHVFTNSKPLPIPWLSIEDVAPGALQVTSGAVVTVSPKAQYRHMRAAITMGWYERITRHHKIVCTARGEHEFGPVEVQSGDVFGIFRQLETVDTPQTLLVYPRYVPVERLGIPARQAFGDFKAIQQLATDPLRIRAVREYAYGDSPRFIHWKASARRDTLQTKLFEPAATPQLFIFCNQDTFIKIWEGIDPQTLELTITVAASLANHALEEGYMVGLQVNAFTPHSDRQVKLLPSRNPEQLTRILESLARIKGWSGLSMEDTIRAERRNLPRGATIVVVTGVVTDDMVSILTAIRRAGHPVTLVETIGSVRSKMYAERVPADALRSQGIVYYPVDAVGHVADVEELVF